MPNVPLSSSALEAPDLRVSGMSIFDGEKEVPMQDEVNSKVVIAPTSFDFREGKCFKMGRTIGAVSFLQILASELNDRMLADFLDMDCHITVNSTSE